MRPWLEDKQVVRMLKLRGYRHTRLRVQPPELRSFPRYDMYNHPVTLPQPSFTITINLIGRIHLTPQTGDLPEVADLSQSVGLRNSATMYLCSVHPFQVTSSSNRLLCVSKPPSKQARFHIKSVKPRTKYMNDKGQNDELKTTWRI
jgi:hypothetical protein